MASRSNSKTAKVVAMLEGMPLEHRNNMPMIRSRIKSSRMGKIADNVIYSARNKVNRNGPIPSEIPTVSEVITPTQIANVLTFTRAVETIGLPAAKNVISILEKNK